MTAKLKSLLASAIAAGIMTAGAIIGLQIVGWLGGMLIWPAVWFFSCLGCIENICPKSPEQEMLARFAIGAAFAVVLVVKMSFRQRKIKN